MPHNYRHEAAESEEASTKKLSSEEPLHTASSEGMATITADTQLARRAAAIDHERAVALSKEVRMTAQFHAIAFFSCPKGQTYCK